MRFFVFHAKSTNTNNRWRQLTGMSHLTTFSWHSNDILKFSKNFLSVEKNLFIVFGFEFNFERLSNVRYFEIIFFVK